MPSGFYLGTPGVMLPLHDAEGSLASGDGPDTSFTRLLGGGSYATVSPSSSRVWGVAIPHMTPSQSARLITLLRAVKPPYFWQSIWAARVNLLTADQSLLSSPIAAWTQGSLAEIAGGAWAPTLNSANGALTLITTGTPVMPGEVVTAGIHARRYANGIAKIYLRFTDATGAVISSTSASSSTLAASGPMDRLTRIVTAPASSTAMQIVVEGASVIAAPSLTFTPSATEWGVGDGCVSAVVSDFKIEHTDIPLDPSADRMSDVSFTVTEVI